MEFRFKFISLMIVVVAISAAVFSSRYVNAARNNDALVGDAASSYNSKCARCHGRDGRSKTTKGRLTHSRDIADADWQNNVSDERIYNSISNGKGKMPAFKKRLSDAQIDELVSYVRRLKR